MDINQFCSQVEELSRFLSLGEPMSEELAAFFKEVDNAILDGVNDGEIKVVGNKFTNV